MSIKSPLTPEQEDYYFREIMEILVDNSGALISRALSVRFIMDELLNELCSTTPQLFSDTYSRLLYIADMYQLPQYVTRELHQVRYRTSKRFLASQNALQEHHLTSMLYAIVLCICTIQNISPPEKLQSHFQNIQPLGVTEKPSITPEQKPFLRLTVQSVLSAPEHGQKTAFSRLLCRSDDGTSCIVDCYDVWKDIGTVVWKYATIHAVHVKPIQSLTHDEYLDVPRYSTTTNSYIVLEPDYIVDVTNISECFVQNTTNPKLHLLKKFTKFLPTKEIVLGSALNFCFDELVLHPDSDLEVLCDAALKEKPLSIALLIHNDPELITILKLELKEQCRNLKNLLRTLVWSTCSIEPSFLSPRMGLQGRLDLLLEYTHDPRRKTIIELKSGKAPTNLNTPAWENQAAQVSCYNILLDETFGGGSEHRSGDSAILYSRLAEHSLRNIPNDRRSKQQVLAVRNAIIAIEYNLTRRNFTELKAITEEKFGAIAPYIVKTLANFSECMSQLSQLERQYFYVFVSFIARENWSARLGNGNNYGFASLWLQSTEEKEHSYSILSHLNLNRELEDAERLYVKFQRTAKTPALTNFRAGDPVILHHPMMQGAEQQNVQYNIKSSLPTRILKGTIKSISPESVVVSLRNKFTSGIEEILATGSEIDEWTIERDFLGNEFQGYYDSLYTFITAPQQKKDVFLGLRAPEQQPEPDVPRYESLTDEQYTLLRRCLASKDYFLLQGPPGTGKTSRMIYGIARYLYEQTDEHFLLLAFTNRAVDEICGALLTIKEDLQFIRLGGKDTSAYKDKTLYAQSDGKSHQEIIELLQTTKIVVSTISSIHNTPELFSLKTFSTIIVDEASQVVEAQIIGVLTKAKRCILVGDEKQLPAVVTQPRQGLTANKRELNDIGIQDLTLSLFERLMGVCTRNGWDFAHGVISLQGRMHQELAVFPNDQFYGGVLRTLSEWQTAEIHPLLSVRSIIERAGITSTSNPHEMAVLPRLAFIPSRYESTAKINNEEAERVAKLVTVIQELSGTSWSKTTVGVITPFRAQITAIQQRLNEEQRLMVTVDTVERYQGGERDTIIISFAVSHKSLLSAIQSLSLDLSVDKKLNVALTRAQQRLIILGNESVLSQSPHFTALFRHLREQVG